MKPIESAKKLMAMRKEKDSWCSYIHQDWDSREQRPVYFCRHPKKLGTVSGGDEPCTMEDSAECPIMMAQKE